MRPSTGILLATLTIVLLEIVAVSSESIAEYLCQNQPPNAKLQHPEHCDVYLICKDDKAIEMKCNPGVMFNPRKNECDPKFKDCPKNAEQRGDDDNGDDDDDEGDAEESESSDGDEDEDVDKEESDEDDAADGGDEESSEDDEKPAPAVDNNKKPQKPPSQKPGATESSICPKTDTDQVTFIMHESDCSLYFLCYHGKPIPFECSMGMHWSNKQKKCVPKEVSECGSISHSLDGGCPERGIKFMPHPNVCQNFIFCLNGAQTVQRCEPFYHWDVNEGKCKLKTMATCYRNLRQAIDTKTMNRGLSSLRLNTKRFGL